MDGKGTQKESTSKATYPGRKQIFRRWEQGKIQRDRLGLMSESPEAGETPLLNLVMKGGKALKAAESLETLRDRARQSVLSLPDTARHLHAPLSPTVEISSALQTLKNKDTWSRD
jgi:nicotinate phosphoribosyltransferase